MGLAPIEHLKAYRVDAGQSQIIFGLSGSSANGVTAISVSSGGAYTSAPAVTISGGGGGGALATPSMGINSVNITPQLVPSAVSISVVSPTGSGAQLVPVYGAPNITVAADLFFNPNSSPAPTLGIASSPGSGANYAMTYSVASLSLNQSSPAGAYTSAPTVTSTPGGGFSSTNTFGFASLTKTVGAGQSDIFLYHSGVPAAVAGAGGATATTKYRPRLFQDSNEAQVTNLYWRTSDPIPVVSEVSGASGSGSAFVPKFGINQLQVDNVGSGYDDIVDILVDGAIFGEINYDPNTNELDPASITLGGADGGYFSASAFPGSPPLVTLAPRGAGSGGAISVSRCRLKRIEASGGTNYTLADMDNFQTTGRLTCTNLVDSSDNPAALDDSPVSMIVGQAYDVTLSSEGAGYTFNSQFTWSPGAFGTISSTGSFVSNSQPPSLSSTKRFNGITISNGGSFTTPPAFSVSAPASGNAPTITLNSVKLLSVANTSRGSGYSPTPALTGSGFFTDAGLTSSATLSSSLSLSGPWLASISVAQSGSGYKNTDTVAYTYGTLPLSSLRIASVSVQNPGTGFSSAPSVSFSGGGETLAATATAAIGTITASMSSFPLINTSAVNPSTGDARKIAYAIADAFFQIFSSGSAGSVAATRSYSTPDPTSAERTVSYQFAFPVFRTGGYAVKDE